MMLYIPVQQEMIECELAEESIIGVYDTPEAADERIAEVAALTPFDPILRTVFDVKVVELNKPIEPDHE